MRESSAGSLRSALRHRMFRRFLLGTGVSAIGDYLSSVAVVVVIYRATHSVGWLGAAAFLRVVAWGAATMAGGVIGDRFDRRRVLVSSNAFAFAVVALLALATKAGLPVAVILLLAMLVDVAGGVMNPSFVAALPSVVGEADLAAANATVGTLEQVSMIAGPALGAVLVSAFSPTVAFWCNAGSFAVATVLFIGVPVGGNTEGREGPPPRLREGLAVVRRSPHIRALLALFVASVFTFGFSMVLFMLVAVRRLGLAESGVGYMRMAEGAGGVLAGFVAGRAAARGSSVVLVAAALVTGVMAGVLGFITNPAIAYVVLGVGGGTYVVVEVTVITWLQQVTDDEVLGRVMGFLMSFGAAATALGAVVAPSLERAIGLRGALAAGGAAMVVAVVLVAPGLPAVATAAARRRDQLSPTVDVLRRLGLFAAASDLTLQQIAAAVKAAPFEAGATIVREGEPADDVFIVRDGHLDVYAVGEAGGAERLVNRMEADDWFGEIGVLTHSPRTATVRAASAVTVWRIPGDVFASALESPTLHTDALRLGMTARLARTHPSRVPSLG